MGTKDEEIGRNVAQRRGNRSQQEIADAMRLRGWKWSQATVWSVEKGERPLRLAEASDLAELLGVRADSFTENRYQSSVTSAFLSALSAEERLQAAMEEYLLAQRVLAAIAGEESEQTALSEDVAEGVRAQLETSIEVVARHVNRRQGSTDG